MFKNRGPLLGASSFRAGRLLGDHADQILADSGGTWYVYYWNGSSFSSISTGISTSTMSANVVVTDQDGDGRDDLFYTTGTSSYYIIYPQVTWSAIHTAVRRNTSAGGSLSFDSPVSGSIGTHDSPFLPNSFPPGATNFAATLPLYSITKGGDVDGDGRQELALSAAFSWCFDTGECGGHMENRTVAGGVGSIVAVDSTFTPRSASVSSIDFNSDGCDDYILHDVGMTVGLSDCFGRIPATFNTLIFQRPYAYSG